MMASGNDMVATGVSAQRKWVVSWRVIKVLLGALSVIGTSLAIYQWYKYIGSDPSVKFNIIDNQCFTKVETIPNLQSSFTFYGRPIDSLWISRVLIVNDCQKNIIGTPYHDLVSSNISFKVSKGFRILEVKPEKNDFEAKITSWDDGFSISFIKWHPDQKCLLSIYCEGSSRIDGEARPCFIENGESFTQGELQIAEYRPFSEPTSLVKHMPRWISFIWTWIGRIIFSLIAVVCFWVATIDVHWIRLFKRYKWNKEYLLRVMNLLMNQGDAGKNSLSIDRMPDEFWIASNIPKPPRNSKYLRGIAIDYDELKPILTVSIIGFMLSLIALSGLIYF